MLMVAFIIPNGTDFLLRSADSGLFILGSEQVHKYVSLAVSDPLITPVRLNCCPSPVSLSEPCRTKASQVFFLRADSN
jgi:hypothetical protein